MALFADFQVEPAQLRKVGYMLTTEPPGDSLRTAEDRWPSAYPVRSVVRDQLGIDVPPPVVYVHRDPAALREHSCLTANAVAFYDGSIHVAGVPNGFELRQNVVHEYTDHAAEPGHS